MHAIHATNTPRCSRCYLQEHGTVLELMDPDTSNCLHRHQALGPAAYSQQQDKIISWKDEITDQELALSFQEPDGAAAVWMALQSVPGSSSGVSGFRLHTSPAGHDSNAGIGSDADGGSMWHDSDHDYHRGPSDSGLDFVTSSVQHSAAAAAAARNALPSPSVANLDAIFHALDSQALGVLEHEPRGFRSTQQFVRIITTDSAQWLCELSAVFDAAEAADDQLTCEKIANIVRAVVLLGEHVVYDALVQPGLFLFIAGALEYDLQSSAVSSALHHMRARKLRPADVVASGGRSAHSQAPSVASEASDVSAARGGSPGAADSEDAQRTESAAATAAKRSLRPRHRHYLCHCAQLKQVVQMDEALIPHMQRVWRLQFLRDTLLPMIAVHPVNSELTQMIHEGYSRIIGALANDAQWWDGMLDVLRKRSQRDVAALAQARWQSQRRLRVLAPLLAIPGPMAASTSSQRSRSGGLLRSMSGGLGHSPARIASPADDVAPGITRSPIGGEAPSSAVQLQLQVGSAVSHVSAGNVRPRALSESSTTSLNSSTSEASFCSTWGEAAPWALQPSMDSGTATPPSSAPWQPLPLASPGHSLHDRLLQRTTRCMSPHSPLYPLRQGNLSDVPLLELPPRAASGVQRASSITTSPTRGQLVQPSSLRNNSVCDSARALPVVPAPSTPSHSPRDAILMLLEMCRAARLCDQSRGDTLKEHSLCVILLGKALEHCPDFISLLEPFIGDRLADVVELRAAFEVLELLLFVNSGAVLAHVEAQHQQLSRVPPSPPCSSVMPCPPAASPASSSSGSKDLDAESADSASSKATTQLFIAASDGLHKLATVASEHGSLVPMLDDDVLHYLQRATGTPGTAGTVPTSSHSLAGLAMPLHGAAASAPARSSSPAPLVEEPPSSAAPMQPMLVPKQHTLLISLGLDNPQAALRHILGASTLQGCGFLTAPLMYRVVWRMVDDPHSEIQSMACNFLRRLCEADEQSDSDSFKAILYDTYIPWLVRPFTHSSTAPLPPAPTPEELVKLAQDTAEEPSAQGRSASVAAAPAAASQFVVPAPVGSRRRRSDSSAGPSATLRARLDDAGNAERTPATDAVAGLHAASSSSVGGESSCSKSSKMRIVEFLSACVRMHSYRAKHAIVRHVLLTRVCRLLLYADKSMALAGLGLIRTCIGTGDELYARLLLRGGDLARVLQLWLRQRHSPGMLQSSLLELLQYIMAHNSKPLLTELGTRYREVMNTVTVQQTGQRVLEQADQLAQGYAVPSMEDSEQEHQTPGPDSLLSDVDELAATHADTMQAEADLEAAQALRPRSLSEDEDVAWIEGNELAEANTDFAPPSSDESLPHDSDPGGSSPPNPADAGFMNLSAFNAQREAAAAAAAAAAAGDRAGFASGSKRARPQFRIQFN